MICRKCNLVSADDARFCGHCGEPFGVTGSGTGSSGAASVGGASTLAAGTATWGNTQTPTGTLSGIIERVKNILMTPKTEWPVIDSETTSVAQLFKGYVVPLAGLAALMSFVHVSVIGINIPFGGTFRTPFLSGLVVTLVTFGFGLLGLYLVGLIINALAPTFSGIRDQRRAMQTAAYAFTPGYVGSVLALLGSLGALLQLLAGLYGIYLLYLGLPVLMKSARDKATGYTVSVVLCTVLVGVLFAILNAVTGGLGLFGGGYGRGAGVAMTQEQRQAQAAATAGNIIGGMLGTDQKGKDGLGTALNNLATAGKQMEQQQAATAALPPTPAAGSSADATANQSPAAATAGALAALGGALGGGRHVDPVDFHALKELLPADLSGLTRSNAEGSSQQAMGVKGSSASGTYQGANGQHAMLKISDMSGVAGLLELANSVGANTSSESDSGYEKDVAIAGRTVHEKFDNPSQHAELTTIVAKRFMVEVTGDHLDMGALEHAMGAVDYARLEAMKDSGLQPN